MKPAKYIMYNPRINVWNFYLLLDSWRFLRLIFFDAEDKAVRSAETSMKVHRTILRYFTEDNILLNIPRPRSELISQPSIQ
jgi:hypothetical protein